jgi:hypothetical protein
MDAMLTPRAEQRVMSKKQKQTERRMPGKTNQNIFYITYAF